MCIAELRFGQIYTNLPNGNLLVNIEFVNIYFYQKWLKCHLVDDKSADSPLGWLLSNADGIWGILGTLLKALADLRGAPGTPPPRGVQILSFSCSFQQKFEK